MKNQSIEKQGYRELFQGVVNQIQHAKFEAALEANKLIGKMYFNIGRIIKENQEKYGWGKSIVERLAVDLNEIFEGREGYSPQNLWYMRQYYLVDP